MRLEVETTGKTIGGYRIVRLLGKGGMADVYEVEHPTLGLRRAMKVFRADGERAALLRSATCPAEPADGVDGLVLQLGRFPCRSEHGA